MMKRLSNLHEEFIDKARRPMVFGNLPIRPLESGVAIIPMDKWEIVESPKRLRKSYKFATSDLRNQFVVDLFEYESQVGHHAIITIDEYKVTLDVYTKDIDQITELDKEYAKHADVLFKDVVYSVSLNEL